MSFHGWNGREEPGSAKKLLDAFDELIHSGIDEDLLIELNDSGMTFDEITDYLDRSVIAYIFEIIDTNQTFQDSLCHLVLRSARQWL